MVDTAGAELGAHALRSRKPKVGDREAQAVLKAEHVLGLQVAMINIERMAVLDRVEQLKKDILDEDVIAQITPLMQDLREEIAVGAIFHDDEGVLVVLDDAMKRHHVRVARCELVEGDLAHVKLALACGGALVRVGKALDGVRRRI